MANRSASKTTIKIPVLILHNLKSNIPVHATRTFFPFYKKIHFLRPPLFNLFGTLDVTLQTRVALEQQQQYQKHAMCQNTSELITNTKCVGTFQHSCQKHAMCSSSLILKALNTFVPKTLQLQSVVFALPAWGTAMSSRVAEVPTCSRNRWSSLSADKTQICPIASLTLRPQISHVAI